MLIYFKRYLIISCWFLLSNCISLEKTKTPFKSDLPKKLQEMQMIKEKGEVSKEELLELHKRKSKIYSIALNDIFDLFVYDEDDLKMENIMVKIDGTITIKLIGEVYVLGKSIQESTEIIKKRFKKYLKYPKISLIPKELNNNSFTIIGKVNQPGNYVIRKDLYITDAISLSRGFSVGIYENNTVELADLEHSFVLRNNKILPINLRKAIKEGSKLHNIPLLAGDYIYISSAANKTITVLGHVNMPGYVGFKDSLSLLQSIGYVGGLKTSASYQAIVIRGGMANPTVFSIDLKKIITGETLDIPLVPNDFIYVPSSWLYTWKVILSQVLPSFELFSKPLGIYKDVKIIKKM